MIIGSDLHLKPESADVVFAALDAMLAHAVSGNHKHLALTGDTYHFRYAIPVAEQNRLDRWLDKAVAHVVVHLLAGNHDSIDVHGQNALEVLARPGVQVYTEPTENVHGLWLPYRLDKSIYEAPISRSKAKRAFVHHGLVGAEMNNGIRAGEKDGVPIEWFAKFETAFFGHWHRHHQLGNCVFVGTAYQTKADEAGQMKGFVELDEVSGKWRHVPLNVGRKFHKYTDSAATSGDTVRLAHDAPQQVAAALVARGIEVTFDPPPQTPTNVRLGNGASRRQQALGYVAANAPEVLDKDFLMKIFDETVAT